MSFRDPSHTQLRVRAHVHSHAHTPSRAHTRRQTSKQTHARTHARTAAFARSLRSVAPFLRPLPSLAFGFLSRTPGRCPFASGSKRFGIETLRDRNASGPKRFGISKISRSSRSQLRAPPRAAPSLIEGDSELSKSNLRTRRRPARSFENLKGAVSFRRACERTPASLFPSISTASRVPYLQHATGL